MSLLIEIEPNAIKDLDQLKNITGAQTYEELLNEAIMLVRWAIREQQKGRTVASVDENAHTYRAIETPLLQGRQVPAIGHLAVAGARR